MQMVIHVQQCTLLVCKHACDGRERLKRALMWWGLYLGETGAPGGEGSGGRQADLRVHATLAFLLVSAVAVGLGQVEEVLHGLEIHQKGLRR